MAWGLAEQANRSVQSRAWPPAGSNDLFDGAIFKEASLGFVATRPFGERVGGGYEGAFILTCDLLWLEGSERA